MHTVYYAALANWETRTFVGRVLPLYGDAVGVFCSSSSLGHLDTRWGSLATLKRCNRCILQPQPTRQPGHSLGESYHSAEMQSVYSIAPTEWATMILVGTVLPLCRDTVGVFSCSGRLSNQDTRWGSLTPLQRCSRYVLQLWLTRLPGHTLGESYPSAEMQSVYSASPATEPDILGLSISLNRVCISLAFFSNVQHKMEGHPHSDLC